MATSPFQSSSLSSLLPQFRARYPMGSVISELAAVQDGIYVVRAVVQMGGVTLASGLAAEPSVEAAEDRAKSRALEALGIQPSPLLINNSLATSSLEPPVIPPPSELPSPPPMPEMGAVASAISSSKADFSFPKEPSPPPVQPVAPILPSSLPPVADLYAHLSEEPEPSAASRSTATITSLMEPPSLEEEPGTRSAASPKSKPRRSTVKSTPPPDVTSEALPPPSPTVDLSDVLVQIGVQVKRLGWSKEQGSDYLEKTYGKSSTRQLDADELFDFLSYLEAQPSESPF